ncbi:VOC family protein [Candidatus Woesearchaeota archaeon]|nr:VOC family protein [Candidatus Woesearchaeota archaeon]
MVSLNGIGQIAINVVDVPRAVAFYRDVLGLPLLFELPTMGFFQCGDVRLMLSKVEPTSSTTSSISSSASPTTGTSIIYYCVDDIQKTCDELKSKGVQFTSEPRFVASMPDHDLWIAFFLDCESNVLALMSEVPRTTGGPA